MKQNLKEGYQILSAVWLIPVVSLIFNTVKYIKNTVKPLI